MTEIVALRFKVWLPGTYRTLWRRIWISQTASLHDLANCILDAFGFDHDHLYAFFLKGKPWSKHALAYWHPSEAKHHPLLDRPWGPPKVSADKVDLSGLKLPKPRFTFLYDFGDEWRFQVKYEGGDLELEGLKECYFSGKGMPPTQYPRRREGG